MNVYFAFLAQNPQVHVFCKADDLRKWAVYINSEALSPMVIILPNKFFGVLCGKNVNYWANISFKSSQFMWTSIWCQTTGQKSKCCLWPDLSGGVFLQILNFTCSIGFFVTALWLLGSMATLDLYLNVVSLWVIPRTAFMCVCLLSSPLWNSFSLTSAVLWNEPGKVSLSCPFYCLFESLCVYRSCLWQCIVCTGVVLCSPPALCASPPVCTHLSSSYSWYSWIQHFLLLGHQDVPVSSLMEEFCPSPFLQSLCILHGPFPSSQIPVMFFPSVCPEVFFCYGERVV